MFSKKIYFLSFVLLIFAFQTALAQNAETGNQIKFEYPDIIIQHIPATIKIFILGDTLDHGKPLDVVVNGLKKTALFQKGHYFFEHTFSEKGEIQIDVLGVSEKKLVTPLPLWMSVIPPLLAILMALVFREVYTSLLIGLITGSVIIIYYQGYSFFSALFYGLFAALDIYIIESLMDFGHLAIIVFSMMIGGMVTLISHNGGMKGVVNILSRYAKSPRSGQFVTWFLGIVIFFDDYANTLVVGNTMRPVTDNLKISRQKLSYIVDSTAAPIAAIAFVTTWIGAELSYIQDGINVIGLNETAYNVFLNSLKFSYYPILALLFILILIYTKREFGPMLHAERKARIYGVDKIHPGSNHDFQPNKIKNERWYNAVIPVSIIIIGVLAGLISTGIVAVGWDSEFGFSKNISNVIGHADSYKSLLWASFGGVLSAVLLTVSQKLMSLKQSIDSLISGFKTMLTAVLILVLAWSIALITKHMHTADFISGILLSINITPYFIPAITFVLAAVVAFSTGSSWGTMAILYPLILPASWLISKEYGLDYDQSIVIFYNVVSTVLSGSVLGDHVSPISDTTILSSLASSCNHIEHVRTQLPYALTVGTIAIIAGTIPAAYGIPAYILLPLSIGILYLVVVLIGKKVDIINDKA